MAKKATEKQAARKPLPVRLRGARRKALFAAQVLVGKKAQRTLVLDLRRLTLITDYFVICHGTSDVHVRALAEELAEQLAGRGIVHPAPQGLRDGRWVLFDLGDVIVHIFGEFERRFYDLERLWQQAPTLEVS